MTATGVTVEYVIEEVLSRPGGQILAPLPCPAVRPLDQKPTAYQEPFTLTADPTNGLAFGLFGFRAAA